MHQPPITILRNQIRIGTFLAEGAATIDTLISALGPEYDYYERQIYGNKIDVYTWRQLGLVTDVPQDQPNAKQIRNITIWFDRYCPSWDDGPDHFTVSPRTEPVTIGHLSVTNKTNRDEIQRKIESYDWIDGGTWHFDGLGDTDLIDIDARMSSPHWKPGSLKTPGPASDNLNTIFLMFGKGEFQGVKHSDGVSFIIYFFDQAEPNAQNSRDNQTECIWSGCPFGLESLFPWGSRYSITRSHLSITNGIFPTRTDIPIKDICRTVLKPRNPLTRTSDIIIKFGRGEDADITLKSIVDADDVLRIIRRLQSEGE